MEDLAIIDLRDLGSTASQMPRRPSPGRVIKGLELVQDVGRDKHRSSSLGARRAWVRQHRYRMKRIPERNSRRREKQSM